MVYYFNDHVYVCVCEILSFFTYVYLSYFLSWVIVWMGESHVSEEQV